MPRKKKLIVVQIEMLDNGYIVTEKGIQFAFKDFDEVSEWMQEALRDI